MNILSIKDSRKTIKLISAAGKKLDARIHAVAVSGLFHGLQCGDNSILTELQHNMPKSSRGNALRVWVTQHNHNLEWSTSAYGGKGGWVLKAETKRVVLTAQEQAELVQHAYDHPFWEKPDTEQTTFIDPLKQAESLVKRLNAALLAGKVEADKVDSARAVVAQLSEVLAA